MEMQCAVVPTTSKKTLSMDASQINPLPKELSWLSFNERVLQEAADPSVPVIERVRYLGIFSNNMDEFFRVRVAEVRRLAAFSRQADKEFYKELLERIQSRVVSLQKRFEVINNEILDELNKRRIYLVNEKQLDQRQAEFITDYFIEKVLPELSPIILDEKWPLPHLTDQSIYFAIKLSYQDTVRYALLELPVNRLSRFIIIPQRKGRRGKVLIVLDNVIRYCLKQVFGGHLPIDHAEAYTIKVTLDAEMELGEGITESLIEKVSSSLKMRTQADPVRFIYDSKMPEDLLTFITRKMRLGKFDSLIAGGRYHNSKDFMNFPNLGPGYLQFKKLARIPVPVLEEPVSIFESIRRADALLYYPYNSFSYIVRFLRAAAIDPQVKSIKINLYRVAKNSQVINSLINAVRNGKEVTVVVELQARFDEQANIDWAQHLTSVGVNVIFGIPGLKVHSKLILVCREEANSVQYYTHVGTGNFHEKTASIYSDFSLLTCDQSVGKDVDRVFNFIQHTYRRDKFKHLMVSPHTNRKGLTELIENEINFALNGKTSGIFIKCNNLVDAEIINKLYQASQAGVRIKIIVRGMCTLVPGVKGLSENIDAISIVDRYLEHARVYVFHNKGRPKYFISSADLMTRNLDYRVEVTCPVYDKRAQEKIQLVLDAQWNDRVKARIIDEAQTNRKKPRGNKRKIRSQEYIHKLLKKTPL